jgi:hypothetical protein
MNCRHLSIGILLLLTITSQGCKKSSGAVAVHGSISFHGEPLSKGTVTFFPASGRPVPASISDGSYSTELMPGDYTAIVDVAPEFPKGFKEGDPMPTAKVEMPDQYTTRAKSALTATVKAGQDQTVDFDLK